MNNEYFDIRSRISEPPKWFDECAVPRYCEFAPHHAAYIYAREAALILIECQGCGHEFKVCMSGGRGSITAAIEDGSLHYGDPPNTECCVAGPTMNCVDLKVLEFWRRDAGRDWERDTSLEIELVGRKISESTANQAVAILDSAVPDVPPDEGDELRQPAIKRWDRKAKEFVEAPDVDKFLAEIVAVCERHGMSIGHEDWHGGFEVYRSKEPDAVRWLMAAHIASFDEDEEN